MAYVNRDPFARVETHKERARGASCAWCGCHDAAEDHSRPDGQVCPAYHGRVWRYRTETDGGRSYPDRETFCSVGCRRDYAG
jgi:hypothetical protein